MSYFSGVIKFISDTAKAAMALQTANGSSDPDGYRVIRSDFSSKAVGDTLYYGYSTDTAVDSDQITTYTGIVANPVFSVVGGNYTGTQNVTITCATGGSTIKYTTNGTTPSATNGSTYSSPVAITADTKLQAVAYKTNYATSGVTSADYSIIITGATFSPVAGTYEGTQTVTIATVTAGDTIKYTVDGSDPSPTHGTTYTVPITVAANTTVKALGYKAGMETSVVNTAVYVIKAVKPVLSVTTGTYHAVQSVTMTSVTNGTGFAMYYTTDGTTPTFTPLHGTLYSGAISVTSTGQTIKAIAKKTGLAESDVATSVITIQAAEPTFSSSTGTYYAPVTVTIASAGNSIHYTTNGTTPSTSVGTPGPTATISSTGITLRACAYHADWVDSTVHLATYELKVYTPKANGTTPFASSTGAITITSSTGSASIYYTVNGSEPTDASTPYAIPLDFTGTTTLKAIAYKAGYTPSAVLTKVYTKS